MNETIFFIKLESCGGTIKHDRIQYFESGKTLKDFYDWIEDIRTEIESQYNTACIVTGMEFINK